MYVSGYFSHVTEVFLLGHESYSLLIYGHQRQPIERQVRYVSHIYVTVNSQISGEDHVVSVRYPATPIRWLSVFPLILRLVGSSSNRNM